MAGASTKPNPLGDGVFFATQDYASFSSRVIAVALDLIVLWLAWIILLVLVGGPDFTAPEETLLYWLALCYLYLTLLKASPVRTVGFAATGVKIVTLKGTRPSLIRMTFRLLLWLFGPFNLFWDLLWLSGDDRRQSLRDKVAGTYVIKKNATPLGRGPIRLGYLFCFGLTLAYLEVNKPTTGGTP
jgi:uncharacterized RDD family membrane protein YckC